MDKTFVKRTAIRQARVALKHLAKPEPQKSYPKRKLRPLSYAERFEILTRVRGGDELRNIVSEMGIPYSLAYKIVKDGNMACITGKIESIHLASIEDQQAASLQIDGLLFALSPQRYQQFLPLISDALREHKPLFVIAQWENENFTVLHIKEAS